MNHGIDLLAPKWTWDVEPYNEAFRAQGSSLEQSTCIPFPTHSVKHQLHVGELEVKMTMCRMIYPLEFPIGTSII